MSNNRIPILGKPDENHEQPLKLDMTNEPGFVKVSFDPPVVRMMLKPREARTLAMGLLGHADAAEYPPTIITPPGN